MKPWNKQTTDLVKHLNREPIRLCQECHVRSVAIKGLLKENARLKKELEAKCAE